MSQIVSSLTKTEGESLKNHFHSVEKTGVRLLGTAEIRTLLEKDIASFCKELSETRLGLAKTSSGIVLPAYEVTFSEAIKAKYGTGNIKSFLKGLGIETGAFSVGKAYEVFGLGQTSANAFSDLLIAHFKDASPFAVADVDKSFRFIIAEVIGEAVRTGYVHSSQFRNWILGTETMPTQEKTMPRILVGDTNPRLVAEGARIKKSSLQFGKKTVSCFKVGSGFSLTDELLYQSSIDMVFEFLQDVGNEMAISKDSYALGIILNGEQPDGSESSPVVGIATANSPALEDIDQVVERMGRLQRPVSRLITTEVLKNKDWNASFPNRERTKLSQYTGLPVDVQAVAAGTVVYLSGLRCLVELKHRSLMMERRRNPETQEEEIYVSDYVGFAKVRRDAAVIQDTTKAISSFPFPAYMDVDSRISQSFTL